LGGIGAEEANATVWMRGVRTGLVVVRHEGPQSEVNKR